MKKILNFTLGVIIFISFAKIAIACMTTDAHFILEIRNLKMNTGVLEKLCTNDSCSMDNRFITIKSHYDQRVSVIFNKEGSSWSIKIRLPYSLDEYKMAKVSGIKPEEYNWKESAKTDLTFLKSIGVLDMSDTDIQVICDLATKSGGAIQYCKSKWSRISPECGCWNNGDIVCTDCGGAEPEPPQSSLPKVLLQK